MNNSNPPYIILVCSPSPSLQDLERLLLTTLREKKPIHAQCGAETYPLIPVYHPGGMLAGYASQPLAERLFNAYKKLGASWEERAARFARMLPPSVKHLAGVYATQTLPERIIIPVLDHRRERGFLIIPREAYESLSVLLQQESCQLRIPTLMMGEAPHSL